MSRPMAGPGREHTCLGTAAVKVKGGISDPEEQAAAPLVQPSGYLINLIKIRSLNLNKMEKERRKTELWG